jgi:F420-non-reducing hydrogenase iron-sulfur subunit
MKDFEPRILAFLCNWAGYAACDLAGTKHLRLPPFLDVRVMCTGRVDPYQLIEAFLNGCDGVMLVGCRKGECRYENGNYYAEMRISWVRKALHHIGIIRDRLYCNWIAADDEQAFKNIAEEFNTKVESLGKLGEAEGLEKRELESRLKALKEVFSGERMRWLIGRDLEMSGGTDVFGNPVSRDSFEKEVMDVFRSEYERGRILVASGDAARSVIEIAKMTAMNPSSVMREVIALKRQGKLSLEGMVEGVPQYKRV